ncbi:C6 transcription factor [Pseudozyma hubeiensis]|nr:C6 transcription factor [Pseudozyma hubeiensis]
MMSPYDSQHPSRPVLARKRTSEKTLSEQQLFDKESPTDSQDGKGKTRARINMACIHCRHRKIKCDGAQPACATCVRLRRECEYEAVTEYENLMSRERKRRNKEKKAARVASLGIFAGQSPLSMLHPATTLGMPSSSLHHYSDLSHPSMQPLFLATADPSLGGQALDSQFGPRRRRGISDTRAATLQHRVGALTSTLPDPAFQQASVSQPPTPSQAYRFYPSVAASPVLPNVFAQAATDYIGPLSAPLMPPPSSAPFFGLATPGASSAPSEHEQMTSSHHILDLMGLSTSVSMPIAPSGSASATEADFDLGMVDMLGVPTVVPTSAHVRPIDLPAPHGHFDFASIPFPTLDTFSLELPVASLRRRSSIHLPVGTADAFRRPSVAEVAAASLIQKVAVKRAEKVRNDTTQLAEELLMPDTTGILAWNAHVQSQMPASMALWSGFHPARDMVPSQPACTSDYAPPNMPASRSNSDGLLSLGPLSPTPVLTTGLVGIKAEPGAEEVSATSSCSNTDTASLKTEVPSLEHSYFASATKGGKTSREISPFALSPVSANSSSGKQSSHLPQDAWSSTLPLLSPVTELNNTFNSFNVFSTSNMSSNNVYPHQVKDEDDGSLSMAFNSTF